MQEGVFAGWVSQSIFVVLPFSFQRLQGKASLHKLGIGPRFLRWPLSRE